MMGYYTILFTLIFGAITIFSAMYVKITKCEEPVCDCAVVFECKKLIADSVIPFRSRPTDAGYDLSAACDYVIPAHSTVKIDSGLAISAPPGYYYTIDGRSSLWLRGIIPMRGIVDATYTGPVIVMMFNTSDSDYHVKKGDRIAQLIPHIIHHLDFIIVDEFSPEYNVRGTNGFGSTGA